MANDTEYFIGEKYLKGNTGITKNVSMEDLTPIIPSTANMYLRKQLGTYFFKYLLDAYNVALQANNPLLLTPAERDLIDEIKEVMAWRVAADAVISLTLQLKNKGVQTQSGDFSQAASETNMKYLYHHYTDKADAWQQALIDFLVENKDDYPQFMDKLNKDSYIKKNHCSCGRGSSGYRKRVSFI